MKIRSLITVGVAALATAALVAPVAASPQAANAATAGRDAAIAQAQAQGIDVRVETEDIILSAALPADANTELGLAKIQEDIDGRNNSPITTAEQLSALAGRTQIEGLPYPDIPQFDGTYRIVPGAVELAIPVPTEDLIKDQSWWSTMLLSAAAGLASLVVKGGCYFAFSATGPAAEALCGFIGGFSINFMINAFTAVYNGDTLDSEWWATTLAQSFVIGLLSAIPGDLVIQAARWLRGAVGLPVAAAADSAAYVSVPASEAIREAGYELEVMLGEPFERSVQEALDGVGRS